MSLFMYIYTVPLYCEMKIWMFHITCIKLTTCLLLLSEDGVHIVIFCMELMSKLRKYMPNLDGLFCSLLQVIIHFM